ncbi:hypothetical protein AVEN_65328-1 [Araneus ventricosus]|uniref:Uncharacterized protein n=1 Tax=Araneus ventricosus TaxID=182803 RepID=A0A4Y2AGD4_ARAVE|nr:hypothetical protein AVEN_65328-1 [Araneus ventricosus]
MFDSFWLKLYLEKILEVWRDCCVHLSEYQLQDQIDKRIACGSGVQKYAEVGVTGRPETSVWCGNLENEARDQASHLSFSHGSRSRYPSSVPIFLCETLVKHVRCHDSRLRFKPSLLNR